MSISEYTPTSVGTPSESAVATEAPISRASRPAADESHARTERDILNDIKAGEEMYNKLWDDMFFLQVWMNLYEEHYDEDDPEYVEALSRFAEKAPALDRQLWAQYGRVRSLWQELLYYPNSPATTEDASLRDDRPR
ncbi:hypothetical protein BGZ73_002235, partial [Actinomortierella ambigua]